MVSYNKLLHKLIDCGMTKTDLRKNIGLSSATVSKISKGEYISLEVIERICKYFNCTPNDILEFKD